MTEILVTGGAVAAIFNVIQALINVDDEVTAVLFSPSKFTKDFPSALGYLDRALF